MIYHLPLFAAVLRDRSTHILDGNARIVWINMTTSTVLNFPTFCVSCPKHTPGNMLQTPDNMQKNTANATPAYQHKLQRATPRACRRSVVCCCGYYNSCFTGRCAPASVITTSLPLLPCCCACVCGVSCALRKEAVWVSGTVAKIVTMPGFALEGASAILAAIESIFFLLFFSTLFIFAIMYAT